MKESIPDSMIIDPVRLGGEPEVPEMGFLFVNPGEAKMAVDRVARAGGEKRFLFNSNLCVDGDATFFVAGPSVGAPMAVLSMEKLIALGAKRIVLVGWCGALQDDLTVGEIILPGQALCGEGTSRYYREDEEPGPSGWLLAWLRAMLGQEKMAWREGRIWSTDAPYRESRRSLLSLQRERGIIAIDMEYSALCSVALFRGIQFAACMLVSDELWRDPWTAGFSTPSFRKKSRELATLLLGSAALFVHGEER